MQGRTWFSRVRCNHRICAVCLEDYEITGCVHACTCAYAEMPKSTPGKNPKQDVGEGKYFVSGKGHIGICQGYQQVPCQLRLGTTREC